MCELHGVQSLSDTLGANIALPVAGATASGHSLYKLVCGKLAAVIEKCSQKAIVNRLEMPALGVI